MQQITTASIAKMSSQKIAALTGKDHKNVKRDIERMLVELGVDALRFERIYKNSMNRDQTEYVLDRELTETLLTGYSAPLRRTVNQRWRELESSVAAPAVALPDFTNRAAADRAGVDEVEAKQVLQLDLAAAAPAIEFVGKYADATGTKGFRQLAELLKVKENAFHQFLLDKKIM